MIVKIGGLTKSENIQEVCKLEVDWIGFDFCKDSPRFLAQVSSRGGFIPDYTSIKSEQLSLGNPVDTTVRQENKPLRVGVFCDEMPQTVVTRIYNFKLDFVQLEGSESQVMIENLRRTVEPDIRTGVKIIKTVPVSSADDFKYCDEYQGVVDYFLFKSADNGKCSDEMPFDWNLLNLYKGDTPFLIGGAVGPNDVDRLRGFRHPQFAGVDVNVLFEKEPGVIDIETLAAFLNALND